MSNTTLAVILARSGATRFPGKMTRPLRPGEPETVVERVMRSALAIPDVDAAVLATSTRPEDDVFEPLARRLGIPVFRGPEQDVTARMAGARRAVAPEADTVIRVCADNPLFSPQLAAQAAQKLQDAGAHVITPAEYPTLPFGFSMVALSAACLERIDREARDAVHREHVENFCYDRHHDFDILYQLAPPECHLPELVLTLDYPEDLERIRLADALVQDLPPDQRHAALVERILDCVVAFGGLPQDQKQALKGLCTSITGREPLFFPTADQAARSGAGLCISMTQPDPAAVRTTRGALWFVPGPHEALSIRYGHQELKRPYDVLHLPRVPAPAEKLPALLLPALLKRFLAGFPPRAGAHQVALSCAEKISHGATRPGFACFEDSLFPSRLLPGPRSLAPALQEEVRFWRSLRTPLPDAPPPTGALPNPFTGLRAEADGTLLWQTAENRPGTARPGREGFSLAQIWNCRAIQRDRALWMNQQHGPAPGRASAVREMSCR
jgi:spore coat polysaccharide biosynthesis protein SpsF (cytidylyltransferase family)